MDSDRKTAILIKALGPIRADRSYKGELLFSCPRCNHEKNKLCVDIENDRFHCWHCNFGHKSSLKPLVRFANDSDLIKEYEGQREPRPLRAEKVFVTPRMPNEAYSLCGEPRDMYAKHALEFLRRRGVGRDKIELYKLCFASEGKYAFRVLVPSFDEFGGLNFFVGRTIYDGAVNYKHGQFDKDVIFNDLFVDWSKPVILTEGPFDAIAAGTNAIPIQGKFLSMNSKLFKKIVEKGVRVYVALDSDADDAQFATIETFMRCGVECFDVDLSGKKDLGEMTKAEIDRAIARSRPVLSRTDLFRKILSR